MKTGDLEWFVESTNPRGHYPLARIMSLNYGNDNTDRSANLRTFSGNYTRPLVRLDTLVPVLAPRGQMMLMLHSIKLKV